MLLSIKKAQDIINIFNLGTDEFCDVNDSIHWVTETLEVSPRLIYTGGIRGWIGDNLFIYLDCQKIRSLGWEPKVTIKESIINTLNYLMTNQWLLQS
jgi:UDP-glucose 4-epimerase